jgi:hypothetical protein
MAYVYYSGFVVLVMIYFTCIVLKDMFLTIRTYNLGKMKPMYKKDIIVDNNEYKQSNLDTAYWSYNIKRSLEINDKVLKNELQTVTDLKERNNIHISYPSIKIDTISTKDDNNQYSRKDGLGFIQTLLDPPKYFPVVN